MPYYIAAAGGTLYKLNTTGTATALTLPGTISLSSVNRARMAVLGRNVVVVNGPTRSVFVDPNGIVRPLLIQPPTSAPTLAAGAAGALSGTFRVKYTHIIKDPDNGNILNESQFSPTSAVSPTLASQLLAASGIQTSADAAVTARRLYRTTTGPGSTFYPWIDLDGNTLTSIADDISDAALPLFAAPTELGTAPGMVPSTFMTNVVSWKNRLFGVGDVLIDTLVYSGNGMIYGWPAANAVPVAPIGADSFGITGIMARRDELGIAKRNVIWKLVGSSALDFQLIKVIEGKGCYATDSVVVIRDVSYFLGEDGVYTWDPTGVACISDEKVRSWFATDTYFNRSQYPNAFGKYNARYHTYELHLAAAGSSNIDRWVSYDIARKIWFGPHQTAAFTPSFASQIIDTNNVTVPVIGGSNGTIYRQNQAAFADDASAIAFDLVSKFHSADTPDVHKLWGELSLISKIQGGAGSTALAVSVGDLNAGVAFTITPDMTKGRERYRTLGPGRFCSLEISENTINQGIELYGYEVPYHELGRR